MKYEFNEINLIIINKEKIKVSENHVFISSFGKKNNKIKKLPTLQYIINHDYMIYSFELFHEKFVQNNNKVLKLIINNKLNNLVATYSIPANEGFHYFLKKIGYLKVKLKLISNIRNMSHMFHFEKENYFFKSKFIQTSSYLSSVKHLDKIGTKYVKDMSFMFFYCSLLKSLSDISK